MFHCKGYPMKDPKQKRRKDLRFEREAKALRRNLEKRKIQQETRDKLKKEEHHGQD